MYDRTGDKIENVNYRFNNNYIFIDIKDRKYSINNVVKFSYLLGIDDIHNYSEFKYQDNNDSNEYPSDLSTFDSFLYQGTEEFNSNDIKFIYDDETEKLNIIGNLFYYNSDFNYSLESADKLDIHILPYNKNVKYKNLSDLNYPLNRITSYVNNIKILTTQKIAAIQKEFLTTEYGAQLDMNTILVRVINTETNQEISFSSYQWDTKYLNISFNEEVNNKFCKLEFLTIYMEIPREEFGVKRIRNERPNIYIGTFDQNNNFIESENIKFYYSWDPNNLKIYFTEEPNLDSTNKVVKLIHYFKIYQFKVYELNYFTKKLNVELDVWNYDDDLVKFYPIDTEGYINNKWTITKGQKNPLYWENINLYKYLRRYEKYILDQSKCESSYFGYQKTSFKINEYSWYNSNVCISSQFSNIQGNTVYKADIITKFIKNNKYEIISLYNDDLIPFQNRITNIDDSDPQTLIYRVKYPYVNFFGNFYDLNGNCYSNEYIILTHLKAAANASYENLSYNNNYTLRHFPGISYKITLTNINEELSSDLVYNYVSPEINKNYGYIGYQLNNRWNIDKTSQYYQFMFKHSCFINENTGSNVYNPYLESIYPGEYRLQLSMYNMISGENGQNDSPYFAKYDEENPEVYDYGVFTLTKEFEELSAFYNYKLEIPYVTVSGAIINQADNSLVYGQGLRVEFINQEYPAKSRIFEYDCFFGSWNGGIRNWTKENHNKLNQTFLFKLFGNKRKFHPYQNGEYNSIIPERYSTDPELKHHEAGIPTGTYNVNVYYNDLILASYSNYQITKEAAQNGNLSSLIWYSPLIDFTGNLIDISGNILSGDNWTVSILNNENELVRNYRYAYSLNEEDMSKQKIETSFKFENLPLSTFFDLRHEGFSINYEDIGNPEIVENVEWVKERKTRYALLPGTYNVQVKYKNKIVKTFSMTFDKDEDIEQHGAYKNVSLNLGEVLKDFNIQFIDMQFNEPAYLLNYGAADLRATVKLYDENYDGNIKNDSFNTTYFGSTEAETNYTFKKQFIGYYRFDYFCNQFGENGDKPKINDIIDAQTSASIIIPSGTNAADSHPQFNLINLGSNIIKSDHTYNILLDYWYGGICYKIYKKDLNEEPYINNEYIYTEFIHKNLNNEKYTKYGDGYNTSLIPMKTGKYDVNIYLKSPDNHLFKLNDSTSLNIKNYNYLYEDETIFRLKYGVKKIKFMVFGGCEDQGVDKIYKIPNNLPSLEDIYFSDSLTGTVGKYSTLGELALGGNIDINSENKIYEYDHFINGLNLYYSFGKIITTYSKYGYQEINEESNLLHLYKLNNDNYDLNTEFSHLSSTQYISYSEINSSYTDILSGGKFKVESLKDGGTYIMVLDKFFIHVSLEVRDSLQNESSLDYLINVYDYNGNLFATNCTKEGNPNDFGGFLDLGLIPAGKYKVEVYYKGINVTPTAFKNRYQEWFSEEPKNWYTNTVNPIYIDLEFPLRTFTAEIVYPGPNNTLLDSNCGLSVNVTKLISYDGTTIDYNKDPYADRNDELTYYSVNKYGRTSSSSSIQNPWTRNSTGIRLKELMPGLYKVKFIHYYFGNDGDLIRRIIIKWWIIL